MAHRDNIKHMLEELSWNPSIAPVVDGLLEVLSYRLKTTEHEFESLVTLVGAREISCFDLYNEMIKPVASTLAVSRASRFLFECYAYFRLLDPSRVDKSYLIKQIDFLVKEAIYLNDTCIWPELSPDVNAFNFSTAVRYKNAQSGVGHLMRIVEFSVHILAKFLSGQDSAELRKKGKGVAKILPPEPIALSMEDRTKVIDIATEAIALVIKLNCIPTIHMASLLITNLLEAGDADRAWQVANLYYTYRLPIDNLTILKYIKLTPNWTEFRQSKLGNLEEPLLKRIDSVVALTEKKFGKPIGEVVSILGHHDEAFLVNYTTTAYNKALAKARQTYDMADK